MAFSEKISVVFDAKSNGFNKVKADIAAADTALGKAKAGAAGFGDMLRNNAAAAASAAGAAIVAFGVKSVKAFQDTALESGKFADATGASVEEASRLREVAGDLGIEFGTVQSAMQRFNKAAADGEVFVEKFGNTVVRASDGTVDAYQSFINAATAIGAIEDPTKQAEAAQKTFGKSYGEIAELMEMDATELRKALDDVSDAKVIDDGELAKAKNFRDALDRLNGVVEDLQNAVGEMVVENADLLDSLAANLEMVVKYSGELAVLGRVTAAIVSPMQMWREALNLTSNEVATASMTLDELIAYLDKHGASAEVTAQAIDEWTQAQQAAAVEAAGLTEAVVAVDRSAQDFTDEVNRAAEATRDLEGAYKDLTDELSDEEAWISVENAIDDYTSKVNEAGASNRSKRQALIDLKQELIAYLAEIEGVPVEKQTEILALIDAGNIAEVERQLAYLTRTRATGITVNTGGDGRSAKPGTIGIGATGGIVTKPTLSIIGEAGPEAVIPLNQMPGASPLPGGGGGITVIVNGANPEQVIAAIKRYERNNGKGWRS